MNQNHFLGRKYELPHLAGVPPPWRLVVLSAILPPASPDLAGISPKYTHKHTHGFKTRIKMNGWRINLVTLVESLLHLQEALLLFLPLLLTPAFLLIVPHPAG